MAGQSLDKIDALKSGSALWVLPDRPHCEWSVKLDWYMNFQLSKALVRKRNKVSQNLVEWALQADIQAADFIADAESPMLIHTARLLPNQQVLHVPFREPIAHWIKTIEEAWEGLGKPSVRIFLPTGFSVNDATKTKSALGATATFADNYGG